MQENKREEKQAEIQSHEFDDMMQGMHWKDIIYEVIKNMNPWDINITELASQYAKRVDELSQSNFKVPANVLIVSSVLLRMKADSIDVTAFDPDSYFQEDLEEIQDLDFIGAEFEPELFDLDEEENSKKNERIEDWAQLAKAIKPKRVPRRRVSFFELVTAIEDVLDEKKTKTRKRRSRGKKEEEVVEMDKVVNMEKIIEETYSRIMQILSKKKSVLFQEIVENRDDAVSTLLCLLHLSNKQKLSLSQEKLFEDLVIQSSAEEIEEPEPQPS